LGEGFPHISVRPPTRLRYFLEAHYNRPVREIAAGGDIIDPVSNTGRRALNVASPSFM
jgi:hypothetical protein